MDVLSIVSSVLSIVAAIVSIVAANTAVQATRSVRASKSGQAVQGDRNVVAGRDARG